MASITKLIPGALHGRVLVADDEEKNRQLLRAALEARGHEVIEAINGEQTLHLVQSESPDVILLDVMMPKMDGFAVCRHLKQDPRTAPIPVLMVTALSERQERLLGIEVGANDFLTKPVDLQDVSLRVRNAIYTKRLFDQLEAAQQLLQSQNQQLREAREAAELASQAKSRFLASMSHELRTPLTTIIGFTEMAQQALEEIGVKEVIPDLERVQSAARHQLALINDVLDLAKVEAGKMTLCLEEFDLNQLVTQAAAAVQVLMAKRANTLVVDCPPDIGAMRADQTKVRQVLFNLLSNASKFTDKGTITLKVSLQQAQVSGKAQEPGAPPPGPVTRRKPFITFQVADTGIGLTQQQISRLFQPFGQAEGNTARQYGGTGLGLVITKHFCEMMGGTIRVESDYGQGSTFIIDLPVEVAG